jgi:sterol desaturase/sphingolipid hydroxylase (fatty acid hydroxylase superfamily)
VDHWLLALATPFFYFSDPSKRLFWGYLLSSGLLGLGYAYARGRNADRTLPLANLLTRAYWWNRSTRQDYVLLFINATLKVGVYIPLIGGQLAFAIMTARFLNQSVADAPQVAISSITVSLLFTLSAFTFDDFTRFLTHRGMHAWGPLWRCHRVHHAATILTPFTVFRTHPVESLINYCRAVCALGFITGLFIWGFGQHLQVWDILGVNALGFVVTALGANLRHSHIPLSFGALEKWLVSPAQHQLHHSLDHHHPNFGSFLSCWDRWFGSWMPGTEANDLRFGLRRSEEECQTNTPRHVTPGYGMSQVRTPPKTVDLITPLA